MAVSDGSFIQCSYHSFVTSARNSEGFVVVFPYGAGHALPCQVTLPRKYPPCRHLNLTLFQHVRTTTSVLNMQAEVNHIVHPCNPL